MTQQIEIPARMLTDNCGYYFDQVLDGATLLVVVDGQRMLELSVVHPGCPTWSISIEDFTHDLKGHALLIAMHGRTYGVKSGAQRIFARRAPGYYSEFLDRWARDWSSSVTTF